VTAPALGRGQLLLMVLLGACSSLGPLALNVYLPGLPAVQAALGGDLASVQATVSLPLIAYGAGLALLGPLADRYGRRAVLLAGLATFCAGCALATMAHSLAMLNLGRAIASVGTATTFIASRAIVADLTPRESLQRSVAQITMIMLVVQMVAPVFGNLVLAIGGWRAIQALLLALGLGLIVLIGLRVPETLQPETRAAHAHSSFGQLLSPSMQLLRRAPFLRLLLQVGLLYSAYPAFISIAPHLMIAAFHRPPTEYSYYYACLPLGYFAGNWFVLRRGGAWGSRRLVLAGAALAAVSAALSLALLGTGVWHPLALFLPAGMLVNIGIGFSLPTVSARAVSSAWPHTGSGWGLAGFAQQFLAAASVQLLGYFPDASPFPMTWLCFALVAAAFLIESLSPREAAARR
jgi:MFS transporter, DHA1 family, multidrug resistance protein